jgi:hypothetical protein
MMTRFSIIITSAFLFALGGANLAEAGNGQDLETIFTGDRAVPASNICLIRHYDAAHLKAHPKQNVTDMLLYVGRHPADDSGYVYYSASAQVKFRDNKKTFDFSGDCGRKLGETGPLGCGIDCDGGGFDIALKLDGAVELSVSSAIRIGDAEDDEEKLGTKGFMQDDQRFVLKQTVLKDCLPVIYDDDLKAQVANGAITQ